MAGRAVNSGTVMLDSDGLTKFAHGDPVVRARLRAAHERRATVLVSAISLTEVLRGGPRDAALHRALSKIEVDPVSAERGRSAGVLLGATGMSGHRCAIDAVVAATALAQERPVMVLTSDISDLGRLVEEQGVPRPERIVVVRV